MEPVNVIRCAQFGYLWLILITMVRQYKMEGVLPTSKINQPNDWTLSPAYNNRTRRRRRTYIGLSKVPL